MLLHVLSSDTMVQRVMEEAAVVYVTRHRAYNSYDEMNPFDDVSKTCMNFESDNSSET
jgi:hypothetical protein